MRTRTALSLSAPVLLIAAVAVLVPVTISSPASAGAQEARTTNANRTAKILRLAVMVLEATPQALADAGVRLNSIGTTETDAEAALALVRSSGPVAGTRKIADLAYTIANGRRTSFSTSLRMPTTTTTVAGTGATTQGFGGYETSEVSMAFDARRFDDGVLAVDYRAHSLRGSAQPGIPAPKVVRSGGFALAPEPGRTHVLGGMVHGEDEATYMLFFVQARPAG